MLLALARWLFVAGTLSSFGVTLFAALILPVPGADGQRPAAARHMQAILYASVALALGGGLVWLLLETAAKAETSGLADTLTAFPSVLFGTRYGQVLGLQALALLAAAAIGPGSRRGGLAAALAGSAVLLEAGHSHAFAMTEGPSLLLASQALHLLGAGAWLGGLLPLLVVMKEAPLESAYRAARRFSVLAIAAVILVAVTALFQGVVLAGGLNGLTGTAYGAVLIAKTVLFAGLMALAANNRLSLTPALAGPGGEASRRALAASVGVETGLGLCVIFAASLLSGLEPGMHLVHA
jgi:putative copper resistance protein D